MNKADYRQRVQSISEDLVRTMIFMDNIPNRKNRFINILLGLIIDDEHDEHKPLWLLGNVHPNFGDAHIIAILNPDKDLIDNQKVKAGCAYGDSLKKKVNLKCDMMMDMWMNFYDNKIDVDTGIMASYTASHFCEPKFHVR